MENILLILVGVVITILVFSFVINNLITRNIQQVVEDIYHKVNKMQDKQKVIESSVNSLGELFILTEKQKDEIVEHEKETKESIKLLKNKFEEFSIINQNLLAEPIKLKDYSNATNFELSNINKMLNRLYTQIIYDKTKSASSVMKDIGEQVESLDDTFSIRRKPSKKVNKPSISPKANKYLNMYLDDFIQNGFLDKFLTFKSSRTKSRFINGLYVYARDNEDLKIKSINPNTLFQIKGWGKGMVDLFREMKQNINKHK